MQYIFNYVWKTYVSLKYHKKSQIEPFDPNRWGAALIFPWPEWGYHILGLPDRWPCDVYRCASILISSVLGWLDGAWMARAFGTAGAPDQSSLAMCNFIRWLWHVCLTISYGPQCGKAWEAIKMTLTLPLGWWVPMPSCLGTDGQSNQSLP